MAVKTNYEKNGSKYYRVSISKDKRGNLIRKPDGTPCRMEFYGKSKTEAEAKRDEFLGGLSAGLNADFKEMSMKDLMRVWLFDVMKNDLADSTFDRYEGIYRNYVVNTPLAHLKVYDVSRLALQRQYNAMAAKEGSSHKIKNLNKLLKTFFYYAMAEGYIVKNPCFKISLPKEESLSVRDDEEDEGDVDPFTDDEIKLIRKHLRPELKMIFELDLGTGLRIGELLALTEDDFDLNLPEVDITKKLKLEKKFNDDGTHKYVMVIGPPKSKSSIRKVPIPSVLIPTLKNHIISQKTLYINNGVPYKKSSQLFTTDSCKYLDGRNILRAWERTLKRAGVRYRKLHNIRHTYATKLFEADVPLLTISRMLGHASVEITAKVYVHVMPQVKTEAAQKLNYLFMS